MSPGFDGRNDQAMVEVNERTAASAPVRASSRASKPRRRAKLVCRRCHEKKIKCDLDSRPTGLHNQPCMNCANSHSDCQIRASRRNLHRKRPPGNLPLPPTRPPNIHLSSCFQEQLHSLPAPSGDFAAPSPPAAAWNAQDGRAAGSPSNAQQLPNQSSGGLVQVPVSSAPAFADFLQDPIPPNYQHFGGGGPRAEGREDTHNDDSDDGGAEYDDDEDGNDDDEDQSYANLNAQGQTRHTDAQAGYLGESGYMPIFSQPRKSIRLSHAEPVTINIRCTIEPLPRALITSYVDVFIDQCSAFCPVIDRHSLQTADFSCSLLLQQAVALVGSVIQPSLLHNIKPNEHYERAKMLLYNGAEPNSVVALVAVIMFYWWTTTTPNVVSMNGSWWWNGVAIRQAQELGFHRELKPGQGPRRKEDVGLRRRIWWTLFARERLTAICQGRPCIINALDCDIPAPSTADFRDPNDPKALVFVQWVRLCSVIGEVGNVLRRSSGPVPGAQALLSDLKVWVHGLPASLRLQFEGYPTEDFNRDVSQLHIPYFSVLTVMCLKRSAGGIPVANTTAILASSCIARIFEDLLARGSLRFLQGMAGWHIAIALLALLHARKIPRLEQAAMEQIHVLRVALADLSKRWPSAKMYDKGIEQLLSPQADPGVTEAHAPVMSESQDPVTDDAIPSEGVVSDPVSENRRTVMDYFPGMSSDTSQLFKILLSAPEPSLSPFTYDPNDLSMMFYDLFDNPYDAANITNADYAPFSPVDASFL